MSRWIDADALKANCGIMVGNTTIGRRDYVMFHEIDSAPSIDIVRCKECKKAFNVESEWICNHLSGMVGLNVVVNADDFCSYGERKES